MLGVRHTVATARLTQQCDCFAALTGYWLAAPSVLFERKQMRFLAEEIDRFLFGQEQLRSTFVTKLQAP
jgi:hypothetical protein